MSIPTNVADTLRRIHATIVGVGGRISPATELAATRQAIAVTTGVERRRLEELLAYLTGAVAAPDANRCRKAVQAGRLAISSERIGSDAEADAAARRAGALARAAGASLDWLWSELQSSGIADASLTWSATVDGWYDAAQEVRQ